MGNCQKPFGITIRLLRLSRKLKQEQLAEKSGLSLRHIKSIERGLSDPTLSTLEKIASALSLHVKELFALEEIRRPPKGIGKDLLAQLENCKESELLRFYACNKILLSKYK
ncbi:helix-turn-helix domain-containing protein [Bilophila wadsworthia]|uniref:helix-turn-helix domain-containing protein n=1 Tax=Bilophila wadsworthia TaxID=35833 RepID=UPI003AB6AD83